MKTKEPPYTERYVRWCGRSVDKIIIYLLPDFHSKVTDPYGNIISQTNEAGEKMTMTYDEDGNQTAVNLANGYSTTYTYDGMVI